MLTAALTVALAVVGALAWRATRHAALLADRVQVSRRELEFLQSAFGRFAPPEVVDDIARGGLVARSEKKDVTVMFVDLKGFTALSERLPPVELLDVLNGWLDRASTAIVEHRGHVAELVGDGILALFGALEANPWQTNDAVHAALAMRRALADYNETLRARGHDPLAMSVGLHHGAVVAGLIGTSGLMKYGVVGLTINLAARVESLTRAHDVDVLVTDAVRASLDPRFRLRPMAAVPVKGVSEPLATFAVDGFA